MNIPMFLNKILATKLGWTNIVDVGGTLLGSPPPGIASCRGQAVVPNWTGNDADAFKLMCSNLAKSPSEARIEIIQCAIELADNWTPI